MVCVPDSLETTQMSHLWDHSTTCLKTDSSSLSQTQWGQHR